jgi:hypothetical protein
LAYLKFLYEMHHTTHTPAHEQEVAGFVLVRCVGLAQAAVMEGREGAVNRQLLHLISWKDMHTNLIKPDVPKDQLSLNLQVTSRSPA